MIIVKIILRVACLPILLILTILKWIGIFISAMSAWIFYLLALIFFITGALSYGFQLETGKECLKIIGASFVVFMLPVIGAWIVAGIGVLQMALLDFVWS